MQTFVPTSLTMFVSFQRVMNEDVDKYNINAIKISVSQITCANEHLLVFPYVLKIKKINCL